jgi:Domain of unknown function (DUF5916)
MIGKDGLVLIRSWNALALAALALFSVGQATAAPPEARAVLVDEAPVLDGVLDDPVWQRAEPIDEFTQVEPKNGEPGSFATEVRILTDGESLFIAFRGYDAEPDQIVANRLGRDELFFYDDHLLVSIDPSHNHRTGYFFLVNPLGGRRDGSFERDIVEANWDGIWYAQARIDADGWTAEIEIPFRTIALQKGADTWGLNLSRRVRRKNEEVRWADAVLQRFPTNMDQAGDLHGMSVASQGIGLDVIPAATVRGLHDEIKNRDKLVVEPVFDAFYRVTPSLTAAVTANTDFAQTEVDDAQLNVTRFDLFFPEKRSFFLQDTGIFNFGGLTAENGIPFFSRRIGLDTDLDSIRLLGGGKLTGRAGPMNLGFLSIQQDGNQGVGDKNLSVARASMNVWDQSSVGVLLTHGNPRSEDHNLLAGADLNLRSNRLIEDRVLTANLWHQQTFSENEREHYGDRSSAWGAEVAYPNDRVNWLVGASELQRGFNPALGFVNRTDIRRYDGSYRRRFRSGTRTIRTFDVQTTNSLVTDRNDEVESVVIGLFPMRIASQRDDILDFYVFASYEDVPRPFFVAPHLGVPAGTYSTWGGYLELFTSQARALRAEIRAGYGGLYDSDSVRGRMLVEWRPSAHWMISAEIDERWILGLGACRAVTAAAGTCTANAGTDILRTTDAAIRLARLRLQINFTPDIAWSTIAQYENVSDGLGIQSRVRWILTPGRELLLVVGQDFVAAPEDFRVRRTRPAAKLSWTFRF